MTDTDTINLVDDFLGSAHVFASAVADVIEARLLKEVTQNQITTSQLKLLKLISLTGTRTIGDVATFLGVSNAAASKAVDKLVRMMLLRRSEEETDRRAIHLSLTQPSRRLLANYDAARQRKLQEIFRDFDPKELQKAATLLDRLSACIVDSSANPEQMCLQCGIHARKECVLRTILKRSCIFERRVASDSPSDV